MNEYFLEVKEFTLNFWQYQPVRIYLFGSWARGEARRSSDVDIAIESEDDISFLLCEFREALENSCIIYNVDVVDMNFAAESLCKKIREEGIVWKGLQNRGRL